MSQFMEKEYIDYSELCELLNIARGTARNWKCAGKIPYTILSKKVYFPKKLILKELKKNIIKSTSTMFDEIRDRI